MNVETAQRLADLRRSKVFSQEGLARKLGLSRQAVSKWERAESSPDTENLISLAKLYGVSLDELLNPSDEIEDDIEFENEDRARQREAEAAERARTHEAAARATEAATQASDAAAKAAQAASWSAQAANAAIFRIGGFWGCFGRFRESMMYSSWAFPRSFKSSKEVIGRSPLSPAWFSAASAGERAGK